MAVTAGNLCDYGVIEHVLGDTARAVSWRMNVYERPVRELGPIVALEWRELAAPVPVALPHRMWAEMMREWNCPPIQEATRGMFLMDYPIDVYTLKYRNSLYGFLTVSREYFISNSVVGLRMGAAIESALQVPGDYVSFGTMHCKILAVEYRWRHPSAVWVCRIAEHPGELELNRLRNSGGCSGKQYRWEAGRLAAAGRPDIRVTATPDGITLEL